MSQDEIKVCLLLGEPVIPDWYATAITEMVKGTRAKVELVVVTRQPSTRSETETSPGVIERIKRKAKSTARKVLSTRVPTKIPITEIGVLDNVERIDSYPITGDGYRVKLPTEAVELIERRCDVVLHSNVGILSGEILNATRYGVLSFHHGNIREYRGGPPGFWEFLHRRDEAGTTLQRLTETLDAGEIIIEKQVDISDATSWGMVCESLNSASTDMLVTAVERITDSSFQPTQLTDDEIGAVYASSDLTTKVKVRYAIEVLIRKGKESIRARSRT